MAVDAIVDASVIAAALFSEEHSEEARAYLRQGPILIAPDLLRLEIASIAAKKVWRGEARLEVSAEAMRTIDDFVAHTRSSATLAMRAFRLAADHHFSAYDAAYLALAEIEKAPLVTLDDKLIARTQDAGLGRLARRPSG